MDDQDEIRAGRNAVALLHRFVGNNPRLEGLLFFLPLALQRDLHHGLQAMPQQGREPVGAEDGDLTLDQARIAQPLDPAKAGRRRYVHPPRQVLVAERCVDLELIEQGQVDAVETKLVPNIRP